MSKYSGAEGWIVGKQSYESQVRTHQDESGTSPDFTKHVIIGMEVFQKILDTKPTAIKVVFGSDGHQKTIIVVPVDENGIELSVRSSAGSMKDDPDSGSGSSGPHCPSTC